MPRTSGSGSYQSPNRLLPPARSNQSLLRAWPKLPRFGLDVFLERSRAGNDSIGPGAEFFMEFFPRKGVPPGIYLHTVALNGVLDLIPELRYALSAERKDIE